MPHRTIINNTYITRYGNPVHVHRGYWPQHNTAQAFLDGFILGTVIGSGGLPPYGWHAHPHCYSHRWSSWHCPADYIYRPPFYFYERHCYQPTVYHDYISRCYGTSVGLNTQQYKDIILERLNHPEDMDDTALDPGLAWDAVQDAVTFGRNKTALALMLLNNECLLQGEDADDLWLQVCAMEEMNDEACDALMAKFRAEVEAREGGNSYLYEPDPATAPQYPDPVDPGPVEPGPVEPGPVDPSYPPPAPVPSFNRYLGQVDVSWATDRALRAGDILGDYGTIEEAQAAAVQLSAGNAPATAVIPDQGRFYVTTVEVENAGTFVPYAYPIKGERGVIIENPSADIFDDRELNKTRK